MISMNTSYEQNNVLLMRHSRLLHMELKGITLRLKFFHMNMEGNLALRPVIVTEFGGFLGMPKQQNFEQNYVHMPPNVQSQNTSMTKSDQPFDALLRDGPLFFWRGDGHLLPCANNFFVHLIAVDFIIN